MRQIRLAAEGAGLITTPILLFRDERQRIVIEGGVLPDLAAGPLILTIAAAPGAAPLVEIPGQGELDLHPALLQVLEEGMGYFYNIWAGGFLPNGAATRQLLGHGGLRLRGSIAPKGTAQATGFLALAEMAEPLQLVMMTQEAYEALPLPDSHTLYLLRESDA